MSSEAEVAAQVAQNIPQEEHTPAPEVEDTPKEPAYHLIDVTDDAALSLRLMDYLALAPTDRYNERAQTQLRGILNWVANTVQSAEAADILLMVQRIERELGIRARPNRLALLYKFVTLKQQTATIEKEMAVLKG